MKAIHIAMAIFVCSACPAFATDVVRISPRQAMASQGQNVEVEGLAHIHPSDNRPGLDIDLGDNSNRKEIIAYIPQEDEKEFGSINSLDGRVVDVSGIVEKDYGQAEIRLTSPDQVKSAQ